MPILDWKGLPPPPALRSALKSLGLQPGAGVPDVCVVHTPTGRAPDAPKGRARWLWLSDRAISADAALDALSAGAYDSVSLAEPGGATRFTHRVRELLADDPVLTPPKNFVAESPAAKNLLRKISQAARTSMPVLLTGETGTGKEMAARMVHNWSVRRDHTFVPINCAAIPNELMEGELFGYTRGAFSGAVKTYDGLVMAAEKGSVFLDEIDDTPHPLQVKLLRVLEDHVVSRLGESSWRQVDFRLIAATNRDLRPLIEEGTFGADLYERLATVSLELPPLRQRAEDLPALVKHFVARYYQEETAPVRSRVQDVTPEALAVMTAYGWPGNIRELRNVIFGALVTKRAGEVLLASDLPPRLWKRAASTGGKAPVVDVPEVVRRLSEGTFNLAREREALEKVAVEEALRLSQGNAAAAARRLGEVGRGSAKDPGGTLRTMMSRLKISAR